MQACVVAVRIRRSDGVRAQRRDRPAGRGDDQRAGRHDRHASTRATAAGELGGAVRTAGPAEGGREHRGLLALPESHRQPELRLRGRAWLFWEDLAYGAQFAHPSVLLVVDDRSGRILWQSNIDMYPLIDGRMPPFVTSSGYRSGKLIVYSTLPVGGASATATGEHARDSASTPPSRAPAAHGAQEKGPPIAKNDLKGECLVTIGDRGPTQKGNNLGDAALARNLTAMDSWAESVGLDHYDSGSSGPDLTTTVYRAVTQHDCKDVLIYISGHGMAPPPGSEANRQLHLGNHPLAFPSGKEPAGGPPAIQLMSNSTTNIAGTNVSGTFLNPAGVEDAIKTIVDGEDFTSEKGHLIKVKAHPDVHFKVKIDSCYSQRFAKELADAFKIDPKKADPKAPITVIEYSSSSWEPSLLYMPNWEGPKGKLLKNPTDNPDEISEFTNGNIHGLQSWTREPEAGKPRDLTAGLIQAFALGASQDWARTVIAANEPPLTHPGAIGPGVSLGTPDELLSSLLKGRLVHIKSGTSSVEEPASGEGSSITTTVGPPSISEGGG